MSITRLLPADLRQIQGQSADNATLANAVTALQFMVTTDAAPLNTNCPTCVVNGSATGFVNLPVPNADSVKFPCPTCKGYLLYHTPGGGVTPPTNPFESKLEVYKILPADILECIATYPESTTLDAAITSLQGDVITYDCPNCKVDTVVTGFITVSAQKKYCPLCNGNLKTANQYEISNGAVVNVYTVPDNPVIPNPIPPIR